MQSYGVTGLTPFAALRRSEFVEASRKELKQNDGFKRGNP
jgi:hypothetical protein